MWVISFIISINRKVNHLYLKTLINCLVLQVRTLSAIITERKTSIYLLAMMITIVRNGAKAVPIQ